ncbi:hypothetical protein [Henriciella algicola]|uniref:Uncharacterized protein n=1 Tax=Henriciella algicola TaxID=1608422 RepID=A0A399RP74_9PROT|nr:hypothetical protein [Henriciella algicola]RIJ31455.1 hypothetical protein D1222_04180 [Henriciella algicola]
MMRYFLLAGALALSACGGDAPDEETETTPVEAGPMTGDEVPIEQQPLPEIVSPLADAEPLTPGTYCYFRDDENVTEGLEVMVNDDGTVSGDNWGIIHQEAAGYYAAFATVLTSGMIDDTAAVMFDTQTDVDGDSQRGSAIWYLAAEGAVPDGLDIMLEPAECEGLEERVQEAGAP